MDPPTGFLCIGQRYLDGLVYTVRCPTKDDLITSIERHDDYAAVIDLDNAREVQFERKVVVTLK